MTIAKDENGVELKIGDYVFQSDSPDELFLITDVPADGLIELNRGCYHDSEYLIKMQEARTYTEAEIREAFTFSIFLADTIRTKLTIELLMDRLNNPKPC